MKTRNSKWGQIERIVFSLIWTVEMLLTVLFGTLYPKAFCFAIVTVLEGLMLSNEYRRSIARRWIETIVSGMYMVYLGTIVFLEKFNIVAVVIFTMVIAFIMLHRFKYQKQDEWMYL